MHAPQCRIGQGLVDMRYDDTSDVVAFVETKHFAHAVTCHERKGFVCSTPQIADMRATLFVGDACRTTRRRPGCEQDVGIPLCCMVRAAAVRVLQGVWLLW